MVDLVGIEPTTSSMPWKRAPKLRHRPTLGGRRAGFRWRILHRANQRRDFTIFSHRQQFVKPQNTSLDPPAYLVASRSGTATVCRSFRSSQGMPFRSVSCHPEMAGTRSPGTTMPTIFSGSAAAMGRRLSPTVRLNGGLKMKRCYFGPG